MDAHLLLLQLREALVQSQQLVGHVLHLLRRRAVRRLIHNMKQETNKETTLHLLVPPARPVGRARKLDLHGLAGEVEHSDANDLGLVLQTQRRLERVVDEIPRKVRQLLKKRLNMSTGQICTKRQCLGAADSLDVLEQIFVRMLNRNIETQNTQQLALVIQHFLQSPAQNKNTQKPKKFTPL